MTTLPNLAVSPVFPPAAPSLFGLSRDTLGDRLTAHGVPRYRADQIYAWVYQKHHRSAASMTNLPSGLRSGLEAVCTLDLPRLDTVLGTQDSMTQKFVLELADGARVECVSMRTEKRLTFCVSSQVGCALKCAFCATGLMGLKRNLRAEEIVAQVLAMGDFHRWRDARFNIVFMGMGEPLVNYEPVIESIRILRDERGLNLGARRITVSTSGVVPGIRRLATERMPLGLALSLHATTDELRNELIPLNRRWPLADLIPSVRDYGRAVGRRVTLEYTLLDGVNDLPEDALRLAAIARSLPSKINLIPYNPVPGLPFRRPSPAAVEAFAQQLYPIAPAVTVRNTLGGEIWAACGQLGGLSPTG
ncbi:MAG: 23S rRNA (adenine(2503)-C(2))-methyltransferase RlmN [Candidatus Eisenbacteria bacterium]|uniref:Probable dual-specificity RNA methyltransferase RlmN n=1 Tax=Eiseniibacteriota bacterium TaxID=2212470 RepID=A0A849SGQ6_UNCEI|nr:23S rRNA (adenine(2503)-C(2))-methyltransferase RlmN [Candidatus Eisenbacteria bacterium]